MPNGKILCISGRKLDLYGNKNKKSLPPARNKQSRHLQTHTNSPDGKPCIYDKSLWKTRHRAH